ncbi:hypothetical protein SmJEL517_g05231 [Synchytrium microbalum]|uniref:3-oxoacyl-[acyl-carrier-protein] reductase n=1 Tax=Synchytrium microbalum TaxID=1806994 RepID=A0A507BMG7_9FUNG|nr:uncharacterized protein SmJEL517_g05231 [Synchytrium microbalum]TPX31430.1 hypothetical protein SmJEL517_g05231 [Synchytrium microbalum]
MAIDYSGQVAIVTGAASGFGRELVTRMAKQQARGIILVDIQEHAGQTVEKELNAIRQGCAKFIRADVASPKDMKHVFATAKSLYGSINIVVPNAGITEAMPMEDDDDDKWIKVVDIDLTGVVLATRLALSEWKKSGMGGVIVPTASLAGLYPQAGSPVYCAAKAGVVMLVRSLEGLKTQGIRVNAVCPSFSPTPLLSSNPRKDSNGQIPKFVQDRIVPISLVVDAFEKAIKDESLAGAIIRITPEFGIDLYKQRKQAKI